MSQNLEKVIEGLIKGKILNGQEARSVCSILKEILIEEPNVLELNYPITIIGDIHGQFFDLLVCLKLVLEIDAKEEGFAIDLKQNQQILFLGDYVDRGYHSVETWEFLMLLKLKYPNNVFLLRGNHETQEISMVYGFRDEILRKYGEESLWETFNDVFQYLPIAAMISNKIFCLHGGLSPNLSEIDQIRTIDRQAEFPKSNILSDVMWSDPDYVENFKESPRGKGFLFGPKPTRNFSYSNGVSLIVRSHQLVEAGYQYWFPEESRNLLVTIWSAPNYCYRSGNRACYMKCKDGEAPEFVYFQEDPKSSTEKPDKKIIPYFL